MQCPNCEYTVVGKTTGYPSSTHCCETCSYIPGTHGPRCVRQISAYAERPRICPGCQTYVITGVSHEYCCKWCGLHPGEHGTNCHRREPPWELTEEYATAIRHNVLQHELASSRTPSSSSTCSSPPLNRCAYVVLLYGLDAEYALGALLVASSLRRCGVQARLVLLHTADVPEARLNLLRKFYDEVQLIRKPVTVPMDSVLCPCSRDFAHPQFLKLHLLELDFDKVLYLDCDIIVRKNLDDLFTMQAPAAMERIMAMPAHGTKLPNRVVYQSRRVRGIQGGVMLLAPDRDLFAAMRQEVEDPEVLRARSSLTGSPYMPSIGNEQDYLTWRYCQTATILHDQDDHSKCVWTHLGCKYNYEVHQASKYFGIGRERWLWLDYENDAAVLHFSAPLGKRAKHFLRGTLASSEDQTSESPRIAFGHRIWDEAVRHLQLEVAEKGDDLGTWLGEGAAAHRALFEVKQRDEGGMKIAQATSSNNRESCGLTFQVFAANCDEGLHFYPPPFAPGPPWGGCFWAKPSGTKHYDQQLVGSLAGLCNDVGILCNESLVNITRLQMAAKEDQQDQSAYETDLSAAAGPGSVLSTGDDDAPMPVGPPEDIVHESVARVNGQKKGETVGCTCADRGSRISLCPSAKTEDEEEDVGAWLKWQTKDQWEFGRLADPPHLQGCSMWRLHTVFRAKVL